MRLRHVPVGQTLKARHDQIGTSNLLGYCLTDFHANHLDKDGHAHVQDCSGPLLSEAFMSMMPASD